MELDWSLMFAILTSCFVLQLHGLPLVEGGFPYKEAGNDVLTPKGRQRQNTIEEDACYMIVKYLLRQQYNLYTNDLDGGHVGGVPYDNTACHTDLRYFLNKQQTPPPVPRTLEKISTYKPILPEPYGDLHEVKLRICLEAIKIMLVVKHNVLRIRDADGSVLNATIKDVIGDRGFIDYTCRTEFKRLLKLVEMGRFSTTTQGSFIASEAITKPFFPSFQGLMGEGPMTRGLLGGLVSCVVLLLIAIVIIVVLAKGKRSGNGQPMTVQKV